MHPHQLESGDSGRGVSRATLGIGSQRAVPAGSGGQKICSAIYAAWQTLDSIHGGQAYQQVCDELLACFDDPELTFSARILRSGD
ncbi:hypothetical protein LNP74_20875 [Klebsiella pneumoniae subsp. pneumoniae]|nr:hypothetical protein [Klebsiella pneumoniae subsp. pneumoniae]